MSYLHPGTVIGPDFESDYVLVQLDDGDSRDVHIDQVRFLPEHYPHVGELRITFYKKKSASDDIKWKIFSPFPQLVIELMFQTQLLALLRSSSSSEAERAMIILMK